MPTEQPTCRMRKSDWRVRQAFYLLFSEAPPPTVQRWRVPRRIRRSLPRLVVGR